MNFDALRDQFQSDKQSCTSSRDVDHMRVEYLGKKGKLAALMADLRHASPEQRPLIGQSINTLKQEIELEIDALAQYFEKSELQAKLQKESLDVSLPGNERFMGHEHVINKVLNEVVSILKEMGFSVQYGPDIESDYYNFEALNFPKDHPARDMQDTFYLQPDVLLRTHTSNTQVRIMQSTQPPIRIISPGKCYRNEDISKRSHVSFHQVEAMYIDRHVNFGDMLSCLEELFAKLFQKQLKLRVRPSFFPFVEPGAEIDICCFACEGQGCSLCKKTGWLEVAGAGMIHPEVLKAGGIDPEEFLGYAWAIGVERIALLRYGIPDIRLFMENRLNFLEQF
jgi:phenylalanyl-tRNA synthetase alpha chain